MLFIWFHNRQLSDKQAPSTLCVGVWRLYREKFLTKNDWVFYQWAADSFRLRSTAARRLAQNAPPEHFAGFQPSLPTYYPAIFMSRRLKMQHSMLCGHHCTFAGIT